jgi:hypothetical protein
MRRRVLCHGVHCLLAFAVALPFFIPAAARADRSPTKGERAAIERAVRRSNAGPHIKVILSRDVRVSTADRRWATAVYSVHFQRSGVRNDDVESIYHRARGPRWNPALGTVPDAVLVDLGWADSHRFDKAARIVVFVLMGILALAILVVLGRLGGGQSSPTPGGSPPPAYEPASWQPSQDETCRRCGGSGTVQCPRCGGGGKVENHNPPPEMVICDFCPGNGRRQCEVCHGTGRTPA